MHPETQTETDVAYATLGDYQQPVPAYSADLPASIFSFPMVLVVSDEIEVVIAAAPGVVTHNDLQQLLKRGVIGILQAGDHHSHRGSVEIDPAGAGDEEAEGGDFNSDYPQQLDIEIATITARMTPILTIHRNPSPTPTASAHLPDSRREAPALRKGSAQGRTAGHPQSRGRLRENRICN